MATGYRARGGLIRVTLDMKDGDMDELEEVVKLMRARGKTEAIRRSVHAMLKVLRAEDQGESIGLDELTA